MADRSAYDYDREDRANFLFWLFVIILGIACLIAKCSG